MGDTPHEPDHDRRSFWFTALFDGTFLPLLMIATCLSPNIFMAQWLLLNLVLEAGRSFRILPPTIPGQ